METWEALLLGIIQGITEFLPVSSSGHLELGQYFLGFKNLDKYVLFNLICHLGTLCAIFCIFFNQIKTSLTTPKSFWQVVLGTLPLFPLVFILKPIKSLFDQPQYLGFFFLISAGLIFCGSLVRFKLSDSPKRVWNDPLTIGIFQSIAILPGISRSGATISAAQLLGWDKEKAITFSFLLAIPAILGGTLLEIIQIIKAPIDSIASISMSQFAVGFLSSFIMGFFALKLLIQLTIKDKWIYFAWYCLAIGIFTLFYFNFIA